VNLNVPIVANGPHNMDQCLAFLPLEEPRIHRFDAWLQELIEDPKTDLQLFLEHWRDVRMDPNAITAPDSDPDAFSFPGSMQKFISHLRRIMWCLISSSVLTDALGNQRGFDLQGTGYIPIDIACPDVPIGSAIVDKQLQLQSAAKFIFASAGELAKVLEPFVVKFHRLEDISKFFHIVSTENLLSDGARVVFFVTTYCAPGLHIVLDADPGVGDVKWAISRDIYVNIDGKSIQMNGISPFGDLLSRVVLDAMFVAMRKDIVKAGVNYSTNLSSVEFSVGELVFSQTDHAVDPLGVYPLFIPCLARAMLEPRPAPYDRLKELLEARKNIKVAEEIICGIFMNCDFCTLSIDRRKTTAAIQIQPSDGTAPRGGGPAVAIVTNGSVVVSDPVRAMGFVVIECNDRLEEELTKWCRRLYWRLFVGTAAAVAGRFGFPVKSTATAITIACGIERVVEFTVRSLDVCEIAVNISEGSEKLRVRWQAIPFAGHFQRLSYLFFFPIFGD
jgi:hypothetical protein